jgi:hypothetical protein
VPESAQISSSRCQSALFSGQAGDLEAEHDPGLAQPDVGDQALEAPAVGGRRARLALV